MPIQSTDTTKTAGVTAQAASTKSALVVVYLGYAIRYLSLIVLIPYFGRVLGPSEYGKVLTAMSLMGVIWMLVNHGFSPVGNRSVAGVTDPRLLAAELGRQLHGRLWLLLLALPAGAVATWASPLLRAEPAYGALAVLVGVLSAFNIGWFFQGTRQFRLAIALEAAVFVLNTVVALLLVRSQGDALWVLVALATANAAVLMLAYALVWRQLGAHRPLLQGARGLLRESTPLFVLGVVPPITLVASSYLLSLFVGAQQVGHFGSAERLATALISLLGPAHQVMLGTVALQVKKGNDRAAYQLMRQGLLWLTGLGTVTLLATALAAPLLVPAIFGPGFAPAVQVLQLLALGFPFAAFSQAAAVYVLVPLQRERAAVRMALGCAVLQLLLLALLAAPLAGTGAALARVTTEILGAAWLAVLMWKMGLLQQVMGVDRDAAGPAGRAAVHKDGNTDC